MKVIMHCFHRGLLGVAKSKADRIVTIKVNKPPEEHALRLRLLQVVPFSLLPKDIVKVVKLWGEVEREMQSAKIFKGGYEWRVGLQDIQTAFNTACRDHFLVLDILHRKLCFVDCPWDGKTIFPDRVV